MWFPDTDKRLSSLPEVCKDAPSLTALPGSNVTSGENVTLLCETSQYYEIFNLSKDGRNASPQDSLRQDHNAFLISPVTLPMGVFIDATVLLRSTPTAGHCLVTLLSFWLQVRKEAGLLALCSLLKSVLHDVWSWGICLNKTNWREELTQLESTD